MIEIFCRAIGMYFLGKKRNVGIYYFCSRLTSRCVGHSAIAGKPASHSCRDCSRLQPRPRRRRPHQPALLLDMPIDPAMSSWVGEPRQGAATGELSELTLAAGSHHRWQPCYYPNQATAAQPSSCKSSWYYNNPCVFLKGSRICAGTDI